MAHKNLGLGLDGEPSPSDTLQTWEAHLARLEAQAPEENLLREQMVAHARKVIEMMKETNSLHPDTIDALRKVGMSEERYRELDKKFDSETVKMDHELLRLYREQRNLFTEVEKASEKLSPSEIYGASMSVMNLFERVMSRAGPPIRVGEPEVVAAGMAKFIDRICNADDKTLSVIEAMSARSLSEEIGELAVLGAKTTRVVILGCVLSKRLVASAPLCAHDAQWLSMTLLSDLERLTQLELSSRRLE